MQIYVKIKLIIHKINKFINLQNSTLLQFTRTTFRKIRYLNLYCHLRPISQPHEIILKKIKSNMQSSLKKKPLYLYFSKF